VERRNSSRSASTRASGVQADGPAREAHTRYHGPSSALKAHVPQGWPRSCATSVLPSSSRSMSRGSHRSPPRNAPARARRASRRAVHVVCSCGRRILARPIHRRQLPFAFAVRTSRLGVSLPLRLSKERIPATSRIRRKWNTRNTTCRACPWPRIMAMALLAGHMKKYPPIRSLPESSRTPLEDHRRGVQARLPVTVHQARKTPRADRARTRAVEDAVAEGRSCNEGPTSSPRANRGTADR